MAETDLSLYKQSFQSIDIPALISDEHFVIQDVNAAGLSFTGYTRDEFIGEAVSIVAGDDDTYTEIVETITNDEAWSGGFQLETKDGRIVYGRGSAAPIFIDGDKQGYVAIFIDTTKRRQYRNTSEVLNRLLRHDLRNDVNVLYGCLQRAQTNVNDENETVSAELEAALEKLAEIITKTERARDLSTMLEETYDTINHPVRLDHALNETLVDILQDYEEAEFYFDDLPELKVTADYLLSSVFEVLIENAVVHNDKDTPTVTIDVEVTESDVVVRIADNGPGVPDADKDRIFGREEQDPLYHGSGISLFFADNVISSYGGDLWVEDNDPEGAIFKFRLNKVR